MERSHNNKEQLDPSRAVVFFDVDNTLFKGFTLLEFAKVLERRNLITQNAHRQLREDFQAYNDKKISYIEFAEIIVSHYYEALKGKQVLKVEETGNEFLEKYQSGSILPAKDIEGIIALMKLQGEIYIISGAPSEAFLPLADKLNIPRTNVFLLQGEVANGEYTGEVGVNMALDKEKQKVVNTIKDSGFNPQTSYAFGDSKGDLPILEAVDNRFIVEPGPEMMEEVERRGWNDSVVTRLSIIASVINRSAQVIQRSNQT